jgi:hypothetical protein
MSVRTVGDMQRIVDRKDQMITKLEKRILEKNKEITQLIKTATSYEHCIKKLELKMLSVEKKKNSTNLETDNERHNCKD